MFVSAAGARESGGNGWQNVQAKFAKTVFFCGPTSCFWNSKSAMMFLIIIDVVGVSGGTKVNVISNLRLCNAGLDMVQRSSGLPEDFPEAAEFFSIICRICEHTIGVEISAPTFVSFCFTSMIDMILFGLMFTLEF